MGEVVDEHVRLGRLNVPGVKAPRALSVFSHDSTPPVDLGIKRGDSLRDWVHGLATALPSLAKQRTRLLCQRFLQLRVERSQMRPVGNDACSSLLSP
jgi:hypothetical protein